MSIVQGRIQPVFQGGGGAIFLKGAKKKLLKAQLNAFKGAQNFSVLAHKDYVSTQNKFPFRHKLI